ncbi:uncharacterized protein LOC119450503 isoform X2 [Dermacentor silvarum]|uniref:uncharacterized protein LOC119450503 isoform X2 n=1 Tax=Dermacentor silvarum TaxID=543639 RepID=UPI00189AFB41|nr:uncharacterized protein LOC119450503 isoform X2 [Dermacentor silvarum]
MSESRAVKLNPAGRRWQEMHHDDQQLTNDLSASSDDAMESLTDNTLAVGAPPAAAPGSDGVVNPAFGHGEEEDERNNLRRSSQQKSLEEEKNAVNQQQQPNGKILNHHRIQIPDDAVINYDTARARKSLPQQRNGDVVALDVFADSAKAQEALMGGLANGGSDGVRPVSSPLTSSSTAAAADAGTKMFEEYFIPVNTHKKFLRGEKLYLTKEKRKVCSGWKRMFFCCLLLMILGIAVLVGVLAATGFLLSDSKSSPKSVHVDPSSSSMYAGSSTLEGAPQPKETSPPPSQQSLPPSSPPIVVISPTTTSPTTQQPTRPPSTTVTQPPATSVATASTRDQSTATTQSPVVVEVTTESATTVSDLTSRFPGSVESSVTTSIPVIGQASLTTVDYDQTGETDGIAPGVPVTSAPPTTAVPTTVASVPSTSAEALPSTESAATEKGDDSTAETFTVTSPVQSVFGATTEAATTVIDASTTAATTMQAPFTGNGSESTTTSSATVTPTEQELATVATSAVPERTTTSPGAVETTVKAESTTSLYETTVASLTERSLTTDLGTATTTSSPTDEESSTLTELVTAASTEERTPTGGLPLPGPNAVVGEITLPEEIFSESLNNKSSTEARDLSNQLKQGLEDILKGLGYRYETVDILKYRKGSVVASFVVVGGDLPAAKVKVAIRDFLAKNNGTLRGRPVDSESVVAKDVTNWCKVANGGCLGSVCEWDYLSGTKTCICLPGTSRLNETACAQPEAPVATTVDENTGITTLVPTSDITEVTSEHPMTKVEWTTTPAEMAPATPQDTTLSETTTRMTALPLPLTTTTQAPMDAMTTTPASVTESPTTPGQETTTSKIEIPPGTLILLATTAPPTTTAEPVPEPSSTEMATTNATTLPTTEGTVTTTSPATAQATEHTTSTTLTTEPQLATDVESLMTREVRQSTVAAFATESSDGTNATTSMATDAGTTLQTTEQATTAVTFEETTTSGMMTGGPLTTDVGALTTVSMPSNETAVTNVPTNETTLTSSVSSENSTEETTMSSVTVPSVMVFSLAPATVADTATESTLATTGNETSEETTTTMSSVYREIDGDAMNGTEIGEFNATVSTASTDPVFVNETLPFNVTDSPNTTLSQVETVTDVSMTTSMAGVMNETESMNATLTYPGFGNGSSTEEVDPDLNVSNRTFSMGRNLTFMNNNTLSDDGVDVVNSTMDSWNMTADGSLLNTANITFGGDDGASMVTESDNTTEVSMTTTQFFNESMVNSTEDMFRAHCSSEEFYCPADGSHTCLKTNLLCDQFEDCPGALDEQNCTDTCGVNFQCKDTSCVMASAKCDGIRDCPDGEDEHNCDIVNSTCSDLEVMCPDSSACIKPLSLCDGIYNCRDRSDESGCVDKTLCEQSNKFYCGDKLCISSALRCDGHEDCKDGEDEVNCTCGENQFQCMNGFCVSSATGSVRCNGIADCVDGSDERGCVQVDNNGLAQAFDGDLGSWTLMCADNATLDHGHQICQEMGYSGALSIRTVKVEANVTSWGSWSDPYEGPDTVWSKGLAFSESCHHGALGVRCDYFECENQTEVLFRIEREATGQQTQNDVWPYLALLHGNDSATACHGEIVSPLWVLTTAYCLQQLPQNASQLYVQAGFARPASSRKHHSVVRVVLHPHYSQFRSRTLPDYDLALVRLAEPLSFANHVASAVCLPDDVARPGVTCFVGSLGDGRPRVPFTTASSIIHLPIVINELTTCNNEEHYKNDVTQKMICGDGRQMKRQLCDGDLGAPLMCLSPNNIWRLAGVLSYQRHCGTYQKHPSVFSNIYEMRDFIHNVTGLLSYNVTHDPQLYTLLEFPMADDGNVSAAVRSHAAGKMAGLEHNASATSAALYSHENILGEHGENGSATTTTAASTSADHDVMFLDLEGIIPKVNHTKDSILDSEGGEGNVTATTTTTVETPTTHSGAGVEARLQEVDHAGAHATTTTMTTTTANATDGPMVVVATTTVDPHESMASLRLMDADSGDVSPSSETSRDASASFVQHAHHHDHENRHHTAPANDTRTESRGRSALLANRTVVGELQAFIERNSAEEMMTTEPGLVENGTAVEGTMTAIETTTGMSDEVVHATTHDNARSLLKEWNWTNGTTSTAATIGSTTETTTILAVTSQRHDSHASVTMHDNGTTTVAPESLSTLAAAANLTGEDSRSTTTEAAIVATPAVAKNDTLQIASHNSTCLGFSCNSDDVCIDQSGVCDGSYDCKDASDEINCVQLKDAVVHGRTKGAGWMPACGDTWDDALSDNACREMGFEKASETSIIALESPYTMSLRNSNKSHEQASILQSLTLSNETCNTKVTMKCHHYQCGHWNATLAASAGHSSESGSTDAGHSGHWPSTGVLSSKDRHCAAHLISNRWLLTSASCMNESDAGSWTFRFLQPHSSGSAPHYSVSGILFNHGVNMSQQMGVALVRLNRIIEVSDRARPICLPEKEAEPKNCAIASLVTSVADHSHQLKIAPVHIMQASHCHTDHPEHDGSTLCVQILEHTTPLCQPAAEAALMCTGHGGQWELRGLLPESSVQRLCSEDGAAGNSTAALHAVGSNSVLHSKHWVLDIVGHGLAVN